MRARGDDLIELEIAAAGIATPFWEVKEHHREHPKAICERAKIGRGWRACPGPSGTSPERMVCNLRLWSAHKGSTTLVGAKRRQLLMQPDVGEGRSPLNAKHKSNSRRGWAS